MFVVDLCTCSLLLDNERWKQAEVPAEFQNLVNSIADGRITLPERKTPGIRLLHTLTIYTHLTYTVTLHETVAALSCPTNPKIKW